MKKKIIYIVIYLLLLALMIAAEAMLAYEVLRLDMLPDLYVAALIGVFAVLTTGVALLLFVHRKGKWIGIARQIIACVLMAVTVAGCVFAAPKIRQLHTTVEHITTNEVLGPTRNIYVLNEDAAQTLADAAEYSFAALQMDEYCARQVIEALEAELQKSVTVTYYDEESLMITDYYNGVVNALILNEGFLVIWEENELYADFLNRNRVLYTVPVTENQQITDMESEEELVPPPDITNTPFIFYVSGMDSKYNLMSGNRSDVNILVVVNPSTKQILLVNTPRDYYFTHPWGNGGKDKLTHLGIYGLQCSIDGLENLYGIQIDHYVRVNYSGLETMVDAVGGITVYSDKGFYCGDFNEVYINAGENHLYGHEALEFARDRLNQPGGDNGRGQNQMKVIEALIAKVTNARTLIANYSQILSSMEGMIATDFTAEDISKLVKMQLSDMAQWNVLTYAVTGYHGNETTYSMPGLATYVMHPYQYTVNYGYELIQRVMNGELLTQEDMTVPR